MEITLEKIELVKDRTGVSYKEAKEALEAAGGSVVDAIIDIEESIDIKNKSKIGQQGGALVDKIKEYIKKGNVSKIIVKREDEVMLNIPVNVGIIGAVIAPVASTAGFIAALGTKCQVELVKDNGEIIDISEIAADTYETVTEKGSIIADELKEKGVEVYESVKAKASEAMSKSADEDGIECECECDCGSDEECDDSCSCGCGCEQEKEGQERIQEEDDDIL